MGEMEVKVAEFSWSIAETCIHYGQNFHGNLIGKNMTKHC